MFVVCCCLLLRVAISIVSATATRVANFMVVAPPGSEAVECVLHRHGVPRLPSEACDESIVPGDIVGPDCLSGTLACGETVTNTTEGGEPSLHGGDYQSWYCMTSEDTDWTGNERMYEFLHPGTGSITVSLSSPCGDYGRKNQNG